MTTLLPATIYRTITLPQGTLRYADVGNGPPLVFVHGIFANSMLWRKVVPLLQGRFRCIAPDLPLGAHHLTMPATTDLSPLGVARLISDFIHALDLDDVTLVGNDTGGALCQLVFVHHPARIGRLVLTNADAFEAFFPRAFSWIVGAARRWDVRFVDLVAKLLRFRVMQRGLLATVSHSAFSAEEYDAYFASFLQDAAVRRDLTRFLQQVSKRDTLAAARHFGNIAKPVRLVWGRNDWLFPPRLGRRLQQAFRYATLTFVAPSRAFVPEDQPALLAQHIAAFVEETVVHTLHA